MRDPVLLVQGLHVGERRRRLGGQSLGSQRQGVECLRRGLREVAELSQRGPWFGAERSAAGRSR